jgi:1-acyl-sn-glycerol-3-phosphate acyltransferase
MKNKHLPGSSWLSYIFLYGLLKPFLFIYFHLFQGVRFHRNNHQIPKGPIFVIGNHHTNWDGFYHAILLYWRFPHFIVHDEAFKNKRYAAVFGSFLGQIRRGRNGLDAEPIKMLKRLVDADQSVSVLPEGDIDMFGRTLPIDPSIAKLAKMLNIPVLLVRISGAHLRAPRWSNLAHHTRIDVDVTDIIDSTCLQTLTIESLYDRIVKGIKINSYDIQAKRLVKVWGSKRAEWLELGLYWCPQCQSYESIVSRGNHFVCINCGLVGHVNKYLLLDVPSLPDITRPDAWDDLQFEALKEKLHSTDKDGYLFSLSHCRFEMIEACAFFTNRGKVASARLYKDRIQIVTHENITMTIPLATIKQIRFQYKDVFEISDGINRYRLWRKIPKWSAYLWVNCVKEIVKL